ncbi:uncharacterized protein BO72DRAFT_11027 [Aspergillus fijiensis CBS 313.89]|uniref:Uncharacterized protein n=1 Tax=Aspergillus fijiensis CBS 313.89 TaxID=1448319 RepID=A0A8G1RWA8_9EURO|nr:uncharacterized protein BO72DRAFT_11027 [Aspergillus fijiensis CBS 313.89]RAK80084.1 hypothetical protein BO72DRAFT_11027 [Aspergillus fijiensis CBS 313.89]
MIMPTYTFACVQTSFVTLAFRRYILYTAATLCVWIRFNNAGLGRDTININR